MAQINLLAWDSTRIFLNIYRKFHEGFAVHEYISQNNNSPKFHMCLWEELGIKISRRTFLWTVLIVKGACSLFLPDLERQHSPGPCEEERPQPPLHPAGFHVGWEPVALCSDGQLSLAAPCYTAVVGHEAKYCASAQQLYTLNSWCTHCTLTYTELFSRHMD